MRPPATPDVITAAREMYESELCRIDDDAVISDAMPNGLWVSAWVWMRPEEVGFKEESGE